MNNKKFYALDKSAIKALIFKVQQIALEEENVTFDDLDLFEKDGTGFLQSANEEFNDDIEIKKGQAVKTTSPAFFEMFGKLLNYCLVTRTNFKDMCVQVRLEDSEEGLKPTPEFLSYLEKTIELSASAAEKLSKSSVKD